MDPTADCVPSRSTQQQTAAEDDIEAPRAVKRGFTSPAMVNGGSQLPQMWYEQENNVATHLPRASRSAPSCVEQPAFIVPEVGRSSNQLRYQEDWRISSAPPAPSYDPYVSGANDVEEQSDIVRTHQAGSVRLHPSSGGPVSQASSSHAWQSSTDQHVSGPQHLPSNVSQPAYHDAKRPWMGDNANRLQQSNCTQGYRTSETSVHVTNGDVAPACPPVARSHGNEHYMSGMYFGPHCYRVGDQTEYNFATASGEEDLRRQPLVWPHQASKVIYVPVALTPKRPAPFNGEGSFEDYLVKFDLLSKINKWDDHMKALELATSLEGLALQVLTELEPQQRESYGALAAALTAQFNPSNVTELFRAKLRVRVRCKKETLPELAHDVQYLTRKAYPNIDAQVREHLVLEKFIEALNDPDLEWYVFQSKPPSIIKALDMALEYETFKQTRTQKISSSCSLKPHQEDDIEKNRHSNVPNCCSHVGTACYLPCNSGQAPELRNAREVPCECACSGTAMGMHIMKRAYLQPSSHGHSCATEMTEMTKSKPMTSPDVQHSTLKQSRQTRVCHKCGLQGHIRRFCPLKQQCYKCGGKGHRKLQCPVH